MPRRIRLEDVRIKSGGETPLVAPTMNWDESEHPRDEDGQFTEKGGGSTGGGKTGDAPKHKGGTGSPAKKQPKYDPSKDDTIEPGSPTNFDFKDRDGSYWKWKKGARPGGDRKGWTGEGQPSKHYAKKPRTGWTGEGERRGSTGSPAKGSDPVERAFASGMARLYEKALQPRKSGDNPSRGERNIRMRVDAMKTAITRVFPKTRTEQLTGRDYSDLESMSKKLFGGRGFSQLGKAEQDKVVYKQSKAWKRDAYR